MYRITEEALRLAKDVPFETPVDLLEKLAPLAYEYGKKITGKNNLRLTFALNALVAVDKAAWQLYCAEKGISNFDQMVPAELKSGLPSRHRELASIPLMSYGVPLKNIVAAVDDGYFFLKIKIGSDPDKDGNQEKMVRWNKERLSAIHEAVKNREIPSPLLVDWNKNVAARPAPLPGMKIGLLKTNGHQNYKN